MRGFSLRVVLGGLALACLSALSTPAAAQVYQYVAQLERPTTRVGAVNAGGIVWQCQGSTCTVSGPWPAPGVPACAALAAQVGRITSYGRAGLQLPAASLARCNESAPQVQRPQIQAPVRNPPVIRDPIIRQTPAQTPAQTPTPEPTPADTTVAADGSINTPELSIVGGAYTTPPPDLGPQRVTTPEMSIIAGPYTVPGADIPPQTVTTPEMSIIGAPPPRPDLRRAPIPQPLPQPQPQPNPSN